MPSIAAPKRVLRRLALMLTILGVAHGAEAGTGELQPLVSVQGTVDAMLDVPKSPPELLLTTQNPGADCGRGTPASVWRVLFDSTSGSVTNAKKQQDLSQIQNTRHALFRAVDGTLFTGGGWCLYKPPYLSTDGGETWKPADSGPVHPPNSTFSFVEFQGKVYAGTGYEPENGQVYRWLGQGNWQLMLDIPPPRSIAHTMVVFRDRLFVGSMIYGWGGVGCEQSAPVYVSSNGSSYSATDGIPPCCSVSQLLVADDQLVAWVYDSRDAKNRFIYRWNDKAWAKVGSPPEGLSMDRRPAVAGSAVFGVGRLARDELPGVYRSTDLGLTWKQVTGVKGVGEMVVQGSSLIVAVQTEGEQTSQLFRLKIDDLKADRPGGQAPTRKQAGENQPAVGSPDQAATVRVELIDGTVLNGRLIDEQVNLQTEYGLIKVPTGKLDRVQRIR